MPSSTSPAVIGRYRIDALLGRGAFSEVYRAYDPQLDREVALKVPNVASERFLREARAAARLRHPHIVPVYDVGTEGDVRFLAARLISGQTLEEFLRNGPVEPQKAARIVGNLANALAYAHKQGIVHRDVKPANVMIDDKGAVFLLDFGLAHLRDEAEKITHDGTVLGTPAYIAPENAAGRKGDPLPASDQYSLGVVLYELLTGRVPFEGDAAVVLNKVLTQEPPSPSDVNDDVPLDLEVICLKAMARKPEDRYADCRELANDLRRFLEDEIILARPLGVLGRMWRWAKREPWFAGGVALATVSFLIGVSVPITLYVRTSIAKAEQEKARDDALAKKKEAEDGKRLADENAEKARQAAAEAEKATEEAKKQEQIAIEETAKAKREAEEAARAEQELKQRQGLTNHYQYVASLIRAQAETDPAKARALLDEVPAEMRGFEWRWLQVDPKKAPLQVVPATVTGITRMIPLDKGTLLLVEHPKGTDLYDVRKPAEAKLIVPAEPILATDGSIQTDRVAAIVGETRVVVSSLREGKQIASIPVADGKITAVALSSDGKTLATLTATGKLILWDADKGNELRSLKDLSGNERLRFSPDGRFLLTCSDKGAKLWEVESTKEAPVFTSVDEAIASEVFSPDSKRLSLSMPDGHVRTWNLEKKNVPVRLGRPPKAVCLAYSPDGKTLATGDATGNVHLWNAATGQEVVVLGKQNAAIVSLCWVADGTVLLSLCKDGSVMTSHAP